MIIPTWPENLCPRRFNIVKGQLPHTTTNKIYHNSTVQHKSHTSRIKQSKKCTTLYRMTRKHSLETYSSLYGINMVYDKCLILATGMTNIPDFVYILYHSM